MDEIGSKGALGRGILHWAALFSVFGVHIGMEHRSDGTRRSSIGIVLALLSWFTMLCHTLPGFLVEIARDGYRKEKVAIHE